MQLLQWQTFEMDGTSIAPLPVYIWLNRKGSTLIGGNKNSTIQNISRRYVPQKESCFNCTKWMSSHTQTRAQFISSVCADWPSSSSKCRTLVKSFISKPVSPLRSSVVEVPSSNIWREQEFNTAGLRDSHLGWKHCHLVRFSSRQLVCFAPRSLRCTKTVLLRRWTMDENDMTISTANESRSLLTAAWN